MKDTPHSSTQIIADAYEKYHNTVLGFFRKRLINDFEAEDLTQNVFIKLVNCSQIIRPETVHYFIFAIAKNLSIDYNQRFFRRNEIIQNMVENRSLSANTTEDEIACNELVCIENEAIKKLTEKRAKVYQLSMQGCYSYKEIANVLDISPRTVEKHILTSRAFIRSNIASVV